MACEQCAQLRAQLERQQDGVEELLEDRKLAEAALRVERRKVAELKREIASMQKAHDHAEEAKALFDYWNAQRRGGRAREFSGKREKNVLDRLKAGYTVVEILQAIDGAGHDCYIAPSGKRFDDLEFICRDATNVERFREAEERRQAYLQDRLEIVSFGEVLA